MGAFLVWTCRMEVYKRGSETAWDGKYHLLWVAKYRCAVLGGALVAPTFERTKR